jgi:hypothetical protein
MTPERLDAELRAIERGVMPHDRCPEFVRAAALLSEAEEAIQYVIEGLIPVGGTAIFAGRPKSGKSTTDLHLGLCVARGTSWLGRSTQQGPVLYVALEGARGYWRAKLRDLGVTEDDELYVCVDRAPDAAITWLRDAIEQHRPVLVIVDTMQRLLRVKDGNDYATGSNATDAVIELARTTGAALLMVHHSGKRSRDAIVDEVMGSTAWAAAVDTVIILRRHGDQRTLASEQRCGMPIEEIVLVLDECGNVAAVGTKAETDLTAMRQLLIAFLREQPEPIDEPGIDAEVAGRTFVKRRALRKLVSEAIVDRTGRGKKGEPYRYALAAPEIEPQDACSVVPLCAPEQENRNQKIPENADAIRADSCSQDAVVAAAQGTGNQDAADELFEYAAEHPRVGLGGPSIGSSRPEREPVQEELDL